MKFSNTIFFLFSIFVVLGLSSCTKEINLPNNQPKEIIGSWTWLESSGGFSGGTINPNTEGYTQKIEFNKSGLYSEYRNDKLVKQLLFNFYTGKTHSGNSQTTLILYTNSSSNASTKSSESFTQLTTR